jgi:nicotinamidase-related amidase
MHGFLEFPVRYCSMNAASENEYSHQEKMMKLQADQTAFILVDVWDLSHVPEGLVPGYRSWPLRAGKITKEKIKPALEAARAAGLLVIHAPTNYVAEKYPQYRKLKHELDTSGPEPAYVSDWPPKEFIEAKRRVFEEDRYWKNFIEKDHLRQQAIRIHKDVEPLEEEYIISTGDQMHEILRQHKILNLVYAGFAANMCLIDKPGALREMAYRRGYNTVLLRDCTTAIESHNTVDELLMTKAWIEWVEMVAMAYTATSEVFIRACDD